VDMHPPHFGKGAFNRFEHGVCAERSKNPKIAN
jgi:hypothetical protein